MFFISLKTAGSRLTSCRSLYRMLGENGHQPQAQSLLQAKLGIDSEIQTKSNCKWLADFSGVPWPIWRGLHNGFASSEQFSDAVRANLFMLLRLIRRSVHILLSPGTALAAHHEHSRRSICQTGKPDTERYCAPFKRSTRWHCPSCSQGTSLNPQPILISLSSLISKSRLCRDVSLWQFNLIVAIECLCVAKGTISSGRIINSNNYWNLPMVEPQILFSICLPSWPWSPGSRSIYLLIVHILQ